MTNDLSTPANRQSLQDNFAKPVRVLIGTDTFAPDVNGAARFTRDHAVRLARLGYDVHVAAPATQFKSTSGVEEYDGVSIHVHRLRSVRWPFHDWLRFSPPWEVRGTSRKILRAVKPQIVHVQSCFVIGRDLAIEADLAGVPVVGTNHAMPENMVEYTGLPKWLQPSLIRFGWRLAGSTYNRVATVTSPTPIAATYLETRAGLPYVQPISCGIDVDRFTLKQSRPTDSRVLYVGRLDREKNLETLIRAFALLPDSLDAQLDIVGSGSEREPLEALVRDMGLTERVIFHGRVTDEELVDIHHKAAVFVMPSPAELQSLASLEAMSSGTPIVVADAMALPHLLTDGIEGFLAPTFDADFFAQRIEHLLALSAHDYQKFSQAAYAKARQHDSAQVIKQYEEIYCRAMQGESSSVTSAGRSA